MKTLAETSTTEASTDGRTRTRVQALLLELGPTTAGVLGERLALTDAGVRRHLDALLAEGTVTLVAARPQAARRDRPQVAKRGRPARVYALSAAGHAAGPAGYDDLAASALRFLAEHGGPEAVQRFADERVSELERRYDSQLAGVSVSDRPAALAAALSADGYAASTTEHGPGVQLCQHHCPVQQVAAEFPQLCEAETAALGRLLDSHVQRLATIAHGDGVCTTYIPLTTIPLTTAHNGKASR